MRSIFAPAFISGWQKAQKPLPEAVRGHKPKGPSDCRWTQVVESVVGLGNLPEECGHLTRRAEMAVCIVLQEQTSSIKRSVVPYCRQHIKHFSIKGSRHVDAVHSQDGKMKLTREGDCGLIAGFLFADAVAMRQPTYAAAFRCIGPNCEDPCCGDWDIPVDRNTYRTYQQFPWEKLRSTVS